jgi:hypothetical protein
MSKSVDEPRVPQAGGSSGGNGGVSPVGKSGQWWCDVDELQEEISMIISMLVCRKIHPMITFC